MRALRRAGSVRLVCALVAAASLAACGGGTSATSQEQSTGEAEDTAFFGAEIPPAPAREALWQFTSRGITDAAAAGSVIAVLERSSGKMTGLDARTGRSLWTHPTTDPQFLLSDSAGPGDTAAVGVFLTSDDVPVPQNGLTPASVRTDLVARTAIDGSERWRSEVQRQPLADGSPAAVGVAASADLVAVAAGRVLFAFDTTTGRERWRRELPKAEPPASADEPAAEPVAQPRWDALALGADTVVAARRSSTGGGSLLGLDRRTGKVRWETDLKPGGTAEVKQLMASPSRAVALVTTADPDSFDSTTELVGFSLRDGKRAWGTETTEDPEPLVLDSGDGTMLQRTDDHLRAVNAQTGMVRWRIPNTVEISGIAAGGGRTYLITASGDDRQVVVVNTRTGRQEHVLPTDEVQHIALFTGAMAVIGRSNVALHR